MLQLSGNIRLIRQVSGLTQPEFGEILSATKAMIISYEKEKASPNELFIKRLAQLVGVSEQDLLNKVLTEKDIKVEKLEKVSRELEISNVMEDSGEYPTYTTYRRNQKNGAKKGIPVFEASPATLSNTVSYRDEKQDGPDFWVTIPNLRDCDYGTRAKGDSMYPLIRTNALVIGREIKDIKVIVMGEIYIIHTKNGIETVKYIHPHETDPDIVILVPYNDKAKSTLIHKSDILRLYEAKAVFNTI